ncbi:MAG: phosphate ABC transporter permease subunit PstC [Halocynthiibacter sp.]
MPLIWLVFIILGLGALGYMFGKSRAKASVGGDVRHLHSLPFYYGANVFLMTVVPSMIVLAVWLLAQPMAIESRVSDMIPEAVVAEGSSRGLVMADVRRVAEGLDIAVATGVMPRDEVENLRADVTDIRQLLGNVGVALGSDVKPEVLNAARAYRAANANGTLAMTIVTLLLATVGFVWTMSRTNGDLRARNIVEQAVLVLLIGAASLAILTTVGIVFSMLFESLNFFRMHPATDFFFGSTWAPNFHGDSELSILPLLWGTLYISIVALLVAVPVGLFAAVYLSEYAGPKLRAFAKPLLEILAGIPTIVYGLFALATFGPFLFELFKEGGTFNMNWMSDARSVITAGVVMGIMLIPFVSSLSDDIINAVPQSLRDGSYGLGATQSETVRQVILPAALPGIVGAILLAASRAIGETMIVVMGAGAVARFSVNPFDSLTTITTRIVSQLTGDGDFSSPETLVAFALGITLFVITLGLNVLALYIVRKYREQYE